MTPQIFTTLAMLTLTVLSGAMALCAGRDNPMALPASLTAAGGLMSTLLIATQ